MRHGFPKRWRYALALLSLVALAGLASCAADDVANMKIEKKNVTSVVFGRPVPSSYQMNDTAWAVIDNYLLKEANAGDKVYFTMKVSNTDSDDTAYNVVLTDKLSPDLSDYHVYYGNNGTEDTYSNVKKSEDVLYIYLGDLGAGDVYYTIEATVNDGVSPTTIYNTALVRSSNDNDPSDNLAQSKFYVPPLNGGAIQYSATNATESFEELLENQTVLLFSFEDLLHTLPRNASQEYEFIASFEQLLRVQTYSYTGLVDLLTNHAGSDWLSTDGADQDRMLAKYENLLRQQSFLFMSFEMAVENSGDLIPVDYHYGAGSTTEHTLTAREELTASFEDLLHRQVPLLAKFQMLEKKKVYTSQDTAVLFLRSFEDLLRLESNLLMSFENIVKGYTYGTGLFMPGPHAVTPASVFTQTNTPVNASTQINITKPSEEATLTNVIVK